MSDDSRSALDPEKIPRRRGLHIRDIKEEAPEPEATVGTELKAAREEAGKDLQDVATALRIKPEHLIALEAAEYDKLPAKTYVVGFVRQYAQQLGLNANEMVDRLKVELEGPPPEPEAAGRRRMEPTVTHGKTAGPVTGPVPGLGGRPATSGEEEPRLRVTSIAVLVILLVLVIFGGWFLVRSSGDNDGATDTEAGTSANVQPAGKDSASGRLAEAKPKAPGTKSETASGAGAPTRPAGSLTALLPGAGRVSTSADSTAGADQKPPKLSDAAAAALPVEHADGASDTDGASEKPMTPRLRTGEVAETAMPQPKLELRTVKSHLPGVPKEALEKDKKAEPSLEDIEAEGVGGEVDTDGQAPPPGVKSKPKQVAKSVEPAAYGAAAVKSRVTLLIRSSTWVRVEDANGRTILERDMRSGDSFRAPDVGGLYLVTKDAGAIEVLLDGHSIGRAGRPDQVLTGLLLSPDKLKQQLAQNTAGPDAR